MLEAHLHPAFSSVPFALISFALIAEGISLAGKNVSPDVVRWSLIGSLLTIFAAFFSGYLAADYGHSFLGLSEDEISNHHLFGKALLFLSVVTVIMYVVSTRARFYQQIFVGIFRLLLVSLWILSMMTGFRGGEMVLRPRIDLPEQAHE